MLCLIEINSMKIELTAHTSYYCVLDLLSVKLTFNNNDNIDNIVAVFNHGKITIICAPAPQSGADQIFLCICPKRHHKPSPSHKFYG